VFYVTGGTGIIKLGDKEYPASEGCLAYVPAGLVHQSITTTEERLCYMLFNVFNSENKEGHGTFAEHIEKVKAIRREQADTGVTEVDEEEQLPDIKEHKYFTGLQDDTSIKSGSLTESVFLNRNETNRCRLSLVSISDDGPKFSDSTEGREISVFILSGKGKISDGNENLEIEAGDLVYIPRGNNYTLKSTNEELKIICLKGFTE
jgi:mannose-6-phosphate isomerase-like protein (cupin superfamily)